MMMDAWGGSRDFNPFQNENKKKRKPPLMYSTMLKQGQPIHNGVIKTGFTRLDHRRKDGVPQASMWGRIGHFAPGPC